MTFFYSASKKGFFNVEINGENIPLDVVSITDEKYQELIDGNSNGQSIEPDENGNPVLVGEIIKLPEIPPEGN
jgi:hypothetical protein